MERWSNLPRSEAVFSSDIVTTGLPCVSGAAGHGRVGCRDTPPAFFMEMGRVRRSHVAGLGWRWKVGTGRWTSAQNQDALSSR